MSYMSGGKPARRDYFWIVIGILFAASALVTAYSIVAPMTRIQLDSEFDDLSPVNQESLLIIKSEFPDDYAILKARLGDANRAGATRQQVEVLIFNFLRDLMAEHRTDLAAAPSRI